MVGAERIQWVVMGAERPEWAVTSNVSASDTSDQLSLSPQVLIKMIAKAGEMVQLVKCLLRMHENLSFGPQNLHKELSMVLCAFNPSSGEADTGGFPRTQ